MSGRKRRSAAARIATQQTQREAQQFDTRDEQVQPIAGERGRGTRVVQDGERLTLIVPRAGEPHTVDLTFLQQVPNLLPFLAEGFKRYAEGGVEKRALDECVRYIRVYFFGYIVNDTTPTIDPSDWNGHRLWAGFINFLNRAKEDTGEPLHPKTRAQALGRVRSVIRAAEASPEWQPLASCIREHIPKNPWPGLTRKNNPSPVLSLDQFDAIVLAADKEFAQLRARWEEGQRLLHEGRERLAAGAQTYKADKGLCLAVLDARYDGGLPSHSVLRSHDPELEYGVRKNGGIQHLASFLYPAPRDLVPLVLLLAARTSFNPSMMLTLEWHDLDQVQRVDGRTVVRFSPYKPRAGKTQIKYCELEPHAPDGLDALLELIRSMTSRPRSYVEDAFRDRLFIYVPKRTTIPTGWGDRDGDNAESERSWRYNLARFIEDHGLTSFTLQAFRPTRSSEIALKTGDLAAARDELGHATTATTWTHYTSDAVRRRQMERVGQVYLVRERWRETDGTIDPRGRQHDPGAATPGFLCLDPNDSPRPGQEHGRPCQAYGECADCPLAGVANDVTAAAQYLAVREAIVAAQHTVAPQTWTEKWAPILAAHDAMLEALDPDVVERAKQIRMKYPPVG